MTDLNHPDVGGVPRIHSYNVPLSPALVREQYADWMDGQVVESWSRPIGHIALQPQELPILHSITTEYDDFFPREFNTRPSRFTAEQSQLLSTLYATFYRMIRQHGQRNDLGEPNRTAELLSVGQYEFDRDGERWHIDALGGPVVRYAVSFGDVGGTQCAHGKTSHADIVLGKTAKFDSNIVVANRFEIRNYQPGTVIQFLAGTTVHQSPPDQGIRYFISGSIPFGRIALGKV